MSNELKVSFYLKREGNSEKAEVNPYAVYPIIGKIIIGNSIAQFGSKLKIEERLWNVKSGRATGKSRAAVELNREINKINLSIHHHYKDILDRTGKVTATDVKNAFQGIATEQETLLRFFNELVREFHLRVGIDKGMTPRTVEGNVLVFRRVVRRALNKGMIRQDPFFNYVPTRVRPKRRWLSNEEIEKIMKTPISHKSTNFVRDMFILSFFTVVATLIEKAFKWFPIFKEMLRMERLCAAIGFTKDMIESLLTKKEVIQCSGRIYSEEHRRKFDIKNDIFKVEENPTDENKLVLTINRQPIGEWFKEQFDKLRQGLRKSEEEPRKSRGFRM